MQITNKDLDTISLQLGRVPEGVQDIPVRGKDGRPIVIRVAAIVRNKPFPSLFWLSDPLIKKEIDDIESRGLIKNLENEILPFDLSLQEKLKEDHLNYIKLRLEYFEKEKGPTAIPEVFLDALRTKGIGGLADFKRVRCLHMHFAHYLADTNCIGSLLDREFNISRLI